MVPGQVIGEACAYLDGIEVARVDLVALGLFNIRYNLGTLEATGCPSRAISSQSVSAFCPTRMTGTTIWR